MLDSADTIARALDDKTRKPARKAKKAGKPKKVKTHRPRKESTKTITTRLYKMWSEVAHERAGNRCEVCGVYGKLDAHHIQPRQICSGLRFDPRNACCLCSSHHKFGRQSAHKGMLWFVGWLMANRTDDYEYLMANLDKELDCKDRISLYRVEASLMSQPGVSFSYSKYDVVALRRDGELVHSVVDAINPKEAETLFWSNWPASEPQLKGIVSCKQCKG